MTSPFKRREPLCGRGQWLPSPSPRKLPNDSARINMRYLYLTALLCLLPLATQPAAAQDCYQTAFGGYSCSDRDGGGADVTPGPFRSYEVRPRPSRYDDDYPYPRSRTCAPGPFGSFSCY